MSIIKGLQWFENRYSWNINNGENLSFWYDNWNENGPLSISYQRLYAISTIKNASIKEAWDSNSQDWNIKPKRSLNEREPTTWNEVKAILPVPQPEKR